MNIRKYRKGPIRGYEVYEGNRVIDAASNRFLDYLNMHAPKSWDISDALHSMMLERFFEGAEE